MHFLYRMLMEVIDVVLIMPICDLTDWHIKVQPVIIHNRWYNKVYSCVNYFYYLLHPSIRSVIHQERQ